MPLPSMSINNNTSFFGHIFRAGIANNRELNFKAWVGTVVAKFDLVWIVMLLHGRVIDGAVVGVDFQLFSKKPCQVNFLKNKN